MENVLAVENLAIAFGETAVVRGAELSIAKGELLALVGASGSGKSLTALAVMHLLPAAARLESGSIRLAETELVGRREAEISHLRGEQMGMIFQEPLTSLNPVMKISDQIIEPLLARQLTTKGEALEKCNRALKEVQLNDPERVMDSYPHQLSGGMRQRVMIAMALICDPALLIADEPTTALDVTVQASVSRLIKNLQQKRGLATLFITHDIALAAQIADRIAVMQEGRIVETAPTEALLSRSEHPYSQRLIAAARKREAWMHQR